MIEFHAPELADKSRVDAAMLAGDCRSDDYCFGNLFIWRFYYKTRIAFWDGMTLISFEKDLQGRVRYLFPMGSGDVQGAIRALSREPDACRPFTLAGVTEEMKKRLQELFPGKFTFELNRDFSDYIYSVEDLVNLAGRKYHGKRNHITRFKRTDWRIEPITPANLDVCDRLNEEWCAMNHYEETPSLVEEHKAVKEAFSHFEQLGFSGGLLRQDGRPVAYTFGEPICRDTFGIHVEKAFSDVEGAYPAINREFLAMSCTGYAYVNREEDVGDEGLRKAKLSYHPVLLLDKYTATLAEGETL
ncbi:DUF2156 domain-containing protein [Ethanoligenens harbinense]|uniref:Phosphatidylglycerol lysyltransferase C-terminal domain-containing protein n=1 Tax=Ethanoligenens harbinense (strain DSM 18485 / JCM 12961 / CGMCC 1.5033 / YUAN-3) TaxID=663278 RepID=E6U7I6_ETHHY|nr:phosphatidylglycerol lysyltransferase domain-containing protein [Ethanoligenens harbinense]ADU27009.1 hypothetical protein Ethha_1472 [Ethanoligenens harbinense YUAN-3]AVQ96096.1 DUF2156 domain-containing protein [Ethanoligenens harbinense YUAN-3]AYF38757.1 DUF2156 domain-containing protein [Ethanoligenens harbinense]AYF41505.1 DUF2156 domain-containing protein [Ethanoligenens harbinense]QCN92337.1 DUF2156 domain-containing protein [Ethanoligenens harbinense]